MQLSGKNVVYVGGFGGIGSASLKAFLKRNLSTLYILDILEKPQFLETLQKNHPSTKINFIKFDITDKSSIKKSLDQIISESGKIDVFVNGAGVILEENIEKMIAINLTGLMNATYAVRDIMDKSKGGNGGVILNIASLAGLIKFPGFGGYCATKHGVMGFTKTLAHDYENTGVCMIMLCPGCTETPMIQTVPKEILEHYRAQNVDIVAEYLVKCVETEKNGGIYVINEGVEKEVEFNPYIFD